MSENDLRQQNPGQASFSLLETVIALGLIVVVVLEVTNVQGNAIYFADYGRNMTRAVWLAQAKMAQIEYQAETRSWSDLKETEERGEFEEFEGFAWKLSIKDWELPLQSILTGGQGGEEGQVGEPASESSDNNPIAQAMKMVFEDESILKIASVEVTWPEGARQESVSLSYLLTNQGKLDETMSLRLKSPKPEGGDNKQPPGERTNPEIPDPNQ